MFSPQKLLLSSGLILSLAGCNLSVTVNEGGEVQSDPAGINCRVDGDQCSADFSNSTTVELTASADTGYAFVGWEGDIGNFCSGTTCNLPMSKNRKVTATFSANPVSEGIPDAVTWGETIYFTPFTGPTATDQAVTVQSNLIGLEQHSQGVIKWTPSHPLFGESNTANLSFTRTTEAGEETAAKTVQVTGGASNMPMFVGAFSVPTRESHAFIGDIDNDGRTELLMVGADNYLYSMEYLDGLYKKDWTLPYVLGDSSTISAITAADLNNDGHFEIFVAYRNQLMVLDGQTRQVSHTRVVDGDEIKKLIVADLTNSGTLDLILYHGDVYWDGFQIEIFDPATLESQWQSEPIVFRDLVVGQLDEDSALEIALGSGAIYDGATLAIEWQYAEPFGHVLTTADLDGNGIESLVAGNYRASPVVFDALLKSPVAELPVGNSSGTCTIGTERGETRDTVLVGDCQWGDISAWQLNALDPVLLWKIDSVDHGSVGIRAGDINNDGNMDYVWSTGVTSSGSNDLVIASKTPAIAVQWQARSEWHLGSVLYSASRIASTVNGPRAIFAGTKPIDWRSQNALISIDINTGDYSTSQNLAGRGELTGISIGDYESDGIDEVFLSGELSNTSFDGSFGMYDSDTLASLWISEGATDDDWAFSHTRDINGDGFLEVIGRGDSKIRILDIKNNESLWSSISISGFKDFAMDELSNGEPALFAVGNNLLWHYGPNGDIFVVKNSYALDNAQSVLTYQNNGETYIVLTSRDSVFDATNNLTVLNESLEVVNEFILDGIVMDIYQPAANGPLWVLTTSNRPYDGESFTRVTAYSNGFSQMLWDSGKLVGTVRENSRLAWDEPSRKVVFANSAGAIISN
ncbi:MAG: VCBS repeat-containing protein [Ketobacteraceae bacterium]|nr:VCBS repeat-containing protein [Ketobacteraceae bacterium]